MLIMITRFIVFGIEILAILFALKSGFIFPLLESIDYPFYDFCWGLVEKVFPGGANSGSSVGKDLWIQVVILFLYLLIYPLCERVSRMFFHVGRHEYITARQALISNVLGILSPLIMAAFVVGLSQNLIIGFLDSVLNGNLFLLIMKVIIMIVIPVLLVIVLFKLMAAPLAPFLFWMTARVFFSSAIKYISVELFFMFTYQILNIRGMMDMAGTLVIILIGMGLCIGSVCMSTFVIDRRSDDYIRGYGTHYTFGPF